MSISIQAFQSIFHIDIPSYTLPYTMVRHHPFSWSQPPSGSTWYLTPLVPSTTSQPQLTVLLWTNERTNEVLDTTSMNHSTHLMFHMAYSIDTPGSEPENNERRCHEARELCGRSRPNARVVGVAAHVLLLERLCRQLFFELVQLQALRLQLFLELLQLQALIDNCSDWQRL
jgi:hypothetical protein